MRSAFDRILETDTEYIRSERFSQFSFQLEFLSKSMNIVGTQVADLAAYPIIRYVMDSEQDNPAFRVMRQNIYVSPGRVRGLKVFP